MSLTTCAYFLAHARSLGTGSDATPQYTAPSAAAVPTSARAVPARLERIGDVSLVHGKVGDDADVGNLMLFMVLEQMVTMILGGRFRRRL